MRLGRPKKRSKSRRKHASSALLMIELPKKRLKWSDQSMLAAIKVVYNGCNIKRAALEHNVPRTMLNDQITGRVQHGSKPGAKPYLNKVEENQLANFIEVVARIGYGKTRKQVKTMVERTARDKDVLRKEKITDGWLRRFIECQPQLSICKGDSTAFACMDAMKKEKELDNYFISKTS